MLSLPWSLRFSLLFLLVSITPLILASNQNKIHAQVTTEQVISKHNELRVSQGLNSLRENSKLTKAAQRKAQEMVNTNCWSHKCPKDSSTWVYVKDEGYNYLYIGENLGHGYSSIDRYMFEWQNSEAHWVNMVNPKFSEIGVGIAHGNFQGKINVPVIVVYFGTLKEKIVVKSEIIDREETSETQVKGAADTNKTPHTIAVFSVAIITIIGLYLVGSSHCYIPARAR